MKTFVISLASAASRRAMMETGLNSQKMRFNFWDAFNPRNSPLPSDWQKVLSGRFLEDIAWQSRPGTFGCAYSHVSLWNSSLSLNAKEEDHLMILEDDVTLSPHFSAILRALLDDLPVDYDFCFLAGWPPDARFSDGQPRHSRYLRRMTHFALTTCAIYLVNLHRLPAIMATILPIRDEIDVHISDYRSELNIYLYAGAFPCALTQTALSSDRLTIDRT